MQDFLPPLRRATDEFVLRAYRPHDGPALGDAVTSSYDHLGRFLAWPRAERDDLADELDARRMAANYLMATDFSMGIWEPDERRLLGGTGFHLRGASITARAAEIGMWIRVDEAGRGLATRVLAELVEWGFSSWPWERLAWYCRTDNLASEAVARKGGFRLEGTLRGVPGSAGRDPADEFVFALLRDEAAGNPVAGP